MMKRDKGAPRRPDANLRRLVSNLRRDGEAMAALAALGVEASTVATFQLGLREPYVRADGRRVERVLTFPVVSDRGRRRFACVDLPGVTVNPERASCWSAGPPVAISWPIGSAVLVVCGSPVELWQLGQAAGRRDVAATLVASSHGDVAPEEWAVSRHWASWDRVILTGTVPGAVRSAIAAAAGRPIEHAPAVECSGPGEVPVSQRHDDWLLELLSGTSFLGGGSSGPVAEAIAGDFSAATIALHGGWRDGRMYYPALVERRTRTEGIAGAGERVLHAYETVVVRSDGAVLEGEVLPAPPGTPAFRRVHALTDGTRIDAAPAASRHATWSLGSIRAFVAARAVGDDPCGRPTAAVLRDTHAFLSSRVWLPDGDDLWVAAAYAVLTHLYRVFDAVPLLVAQGPRGSGKSELGLAVAAVGFNAAMMGQGSAAALVRLARDGGGLVVLDDAECLGPGASGFTDLSQTLKLGYKGRTARKPVTLPSGRVATLDFYGPRLVTTTRGVEPVLGSRCVTVLTAPSGGARPPCDVDPESLRDELHVVGMARAADVDRRYRELMTGRGDREDEIWAPLEAVAGVLGPPAMVSAIARRRRVAASTLAAVEMLASAAS